MGTYWDTMRIPNKGFNCLFYSGNGKKKLFVVQVLLFLTESCLISVCNDQMPFSAPEQPCECEQQQQHSDFIVCLQAVSVNNQTDWKVVVFIVQPMAYCYI